MKYFRNPYFQSRKNTIFRSRSGFSMVEIVVVMIIVGVLLGVALPNFNIIIEKFRASEGEQIVISILGAQKRYFLENDQYASNIDWLDIEVRPSDKFSQPTAIDPGGGGGYVGSIRRDISIPYFLWVHSDGRIFCYGAASSHPYCTKMNYKEKP